MSSTIAQIGNCRYLRQLQFIFWRPSIAAGNFEDLPEIISNFNNNDLLCVPSSESPDWGGPSTIMNIGMNNLRYEELKQKLGADAASSIYINFVQAYSLHVARLDPAFLIQLKLKIVQHWPRY